MDRAFCSMLIAAMTLTAAILPGQTAAAQDTDDPPPRYDPHEEDRQVVSWTLIGGGALFLLGGFAAGLRVDDLQAQIDDQKLEDPDDEDQLNTLRDKRNTLSNLRLVGYIGGVGLAIGGATMIIIQAVSDDTESTLSLSPWWTEDTGGVIFEGRF